MWQELVGLALLAGGALALAGGRVLETLLFGVSSTDWDTFVAVTIVLPRCARRAARIDPLIALRSE